MKVDIDSLICSCLLSLVISLGDTDKILSAITALLITMPEQVHIPVKVSCGASSCIALVPKLVFFFWQVHNIQHAHSLSLFSPSLFFPLGSLHHALSSNVSASCSPERSV